MLRPGERVVAGISGGADSVCLLFVLLGLREEWKLTIHVVHVNHGIREEAGEDAAFVEALCRQYDLPFTLLSDPERKAIEEYGVWQEKKLYGKVSMGIVRTTYIIDEQGMIENVMPKVKPDTNAAQILEYLNGGSL